MGSISLAPALRGAKVTEPINAIHAKPLAIRFISPAITFVLSTDVDVIRNGRKQPRRTRMSRRGFPSRYILREEPQADYRGRARGTFWSLSVARWAAGKLNGAETF